jgi:hypothetical protein
VGLWYRHGPGRPDTLARDLLPEAGATPITAEDAEDDFWADDDDGAGGGDDGEAADDDGEAEVDRLPPAGVRPASTPDGPAAPP